MVKVDTFKDERPGARRGRKKQWLVDGALHSGELVESLSLD